MRRGRKRKPAVRGHHEFIKWFEEEIDLQGLTLTGVSRSAGLGTHRASEWRKGQTPNIANFDAALQVLGYRLAIVDIGDAAYDTGI